MSCTIQINNIGNRGQVGSSWHILHFYPIYLAAPDACGGSPTPPPPAGCGAPHWKGDNWCDDENNNEGCDWDGGDCCGPDVRDKYCTKCECLDPEKQ